MTEAAVVAAVERLVAERDGRRPARVELRASPRRSSHDLVDIDLRLQDGREVRLMLKRPGRSPPASRPHLVHDTGREEAVYRLILRPAGLDVPEFWGPVGDGTDLLMERSPGASLTEAGSLGAWEEAARWIAGMQAAATGRARRHARAARLVSFDRPHHRAWLARAMEHGGGAELARVAAVHGRVLALVARQRRTLVHGEFYPANILVEEAGGRPRIRPVDWETAGLGPALLDLAALTSGRWDDGARHAVAMAYRKALPVARRPSEDELMTGLDACSVLVAVQWLGWAPGWMPPPEHRQDWLTLAGEALDRLRL